ncbi:acetamidase/formamidase family protein, partial [Desulfovibrio sp. OttesenSCG-928-C14]|nr:acetamidase/formamidase family protein [Desulfovibrio sp. OttesenSCG-928-C14]
LIRADKYVLALSGDAEPVARVGQGVAVRFETKDCFSNTLTSEDMPFTTVSWDCINPATGPVYVEGAEPGDILKVEILDIEVAERGVIASAPGFGEMGDNMDEVTRLVPVRDGKALFDWPVQGGVLRRELPIRPMIGVIGVAPAGDAVPTGTPDAHGGNMDCKRIVKGAVLYLPVFAPGALFALGDLHAVMGDGEVVVCGLEIPGLVTVSFTVLKGRKLPTPLLMEGGQLMALGSAKTLDEAAGLATRNMQSFLVEELGLDRSAAGMLLSVEGDLRICQVVDPLKTVRMEISLEILEQRGYRLP